MSHQRFQWLSAGLFLLTGTVLLLAPAEQLPDFYHRIFMAGMLFLSPLLVWLPRLLLGKNVTIRKEVLVTRMQSAIAFALLLNNGGELGLFQLYRYGFEYDKFTHFLVPMLFAFILAESLHAWERFPTTKILWATALIIFSAGILWEGLEFGSDILFHTAEWGVYGAGVVSDTIKDILFNIIGIVAGLTVFLIPKPRPEKA